VLIAATAALAATAAMIAGCASVDSSADQAVNAAAPGVHPLGDGFLGDTVSPTPEATVTPEPGSWHGVKPPAGYRVVLISASDDDATTTLATAVEEWAVREDVIFQALTASDDDEVEDRINQAVATDADLVIGAGNDVVDVFALLTSQHLAQQFLVVGAELPEPTANVVSVIWPGAMFRGTGLGSAGEVDATSVTPARAGDAVEAGVASVLHGLTGIVLDLG
jgi:hypothetical protein